MGTENTFSFENIFANILQYSVDGIVVTDETGTILFWNDAQEKIVNIPASEAVGQKLWHVLFAASPTFCQKEAVHLDLQKGFMLAGFIRNVTSLKLLEQQSFEKEIERIKSEEFELKIAAQKRELTTMAIQCANKNQTLGQIRDALKTMSSNKKISPAELRPLIKKIEDNISLDKDWKTFRIHFDHVHPSFFDKLKVKCPSITLSDQKLCAYIKIGLSPKEISRISNLSFDGLKSAKFRLKKKFKLDINQSLSTVIHDL